MAESKINPDDYTLITAKDAALDLFRKSRGERITLDTPEGYHIEIDGRKGQQAIGGRDTPSADIDKLAFNESYQYLKNAEDRLNTDTPEGYSNCKVDCRNALISTLKTLTGKEDVREATKELAKQGVLGKREEDFVKSFVDFIAKLHGLVSKKGPHPPMTREKDDAELALNITRSTINYIINQAIRQRGK